jgi:hypothetical protein
MMIPVAMLSFVAEAFFTGLMENVAGDVYEKLKGDPARGAFKQALGIAIQRYATGQRLTLAGPLLDEQGFLTQSTVAAELTHIIRFDREPDYKFVGDRWKQNLESPPHWRDFTEEARRLLDYLESELRDTDVFRPVFEAKDLNQVAANAEVATEYLAHIEAQLGDLVELMQSRFGGINASFLNATFGIRDQIRDYTSYIEEKTRGFVGRQFIFDAVDQFLNGKSQGYILVRGDPGIGKTALAAQIVKTRGSVHHAGWRFPQKTPG